MNFWKVDLTTRDGAEGAARLGSLVSFIAAGLTILGALLIYLGVGLPFGGRTLHADNSAALVSILAGVAVEFAIFLITGFRLRAHKGLVWGGLASLLIAIELVGKVLSVSIFGILINGVMLIALVNGVRGAWALRRDGFADDLGDVFT